MTKQPRYRPFPRGPLFGAITLVILSILLAGVSRYTGLGSVQVDPANPVETRVLRFEDRSDGSVAVLDASDGRVIEMLAPGTNGFVRGVLRGLVRERKLSGIGSELPFQLVRWDDGRLSLKDTATGRQIELVSFGRTQIETFAKMLRAEPDSRNFASVTKAEDSK